jgi:hypothetical protein
MAAKMQQQQQAKHTNTMESETRHDSKRGGLLTLSARMLPSAKVYLVFDLLCSISIAQRGYSFLEVEARGTKVGTHHRLRVATEGVLTEAKADVRTQTKEQEESEGDEHRGEKTSFATRRTGR